MAGEFDFEPVSEAALREYTSYRYAEHVRAIAGEALVSRVAMRALVEAQDVIKRAEREGVTDIPAFVRAVERLDEKWAKLRALVAHVGGGE